MTTFQEHLEEYLDRRLTPEEVVGLNDATGWTHDPYTNVTLRDVVVQHCHIGYGGHVDEELDEESVAYEAVALNDFERELLVAARRARARVLREAIETVHVPPILSEDWREDPCPRCGGRGWHDDGCPIPEEE